MLLSEVDLPPTFTEYLAAKGLYDVEKLTQSQFSTNYTAWLTLVFNTDTVQSWLATKGYSYADNQFTVSLNQNSGSLLPTISYKSGGATITIDQATLDALFSNKEAIDVSTGKVLQERWYADLNNAPAVKTIADQSFDEDHPVSYTIPAGTFTDVDSTSLTYTAALADNTALPSWLTFNSATRTFSGTPPQNYNGTLDLKVTVSDGLLSASSSFKLTINPVNDDPTGSATAIFADGEEDVAYTISAVDLLKGFSDVDIATNGDILSVSGLTADQGTVTDNGDGTFTITPTTNFNGTIHLSYSVVDKAGASVAATQT
ncbi:cadherin-like domain-containing protein, partial [Microvirga sp. G4-2]|uniref:cadherin-like domain-containing protein n=1 Tax=Microvirga sp. G4-2 TaxID=3434467 RepID=UPI0040447288